MAAKKKAAKVGASAGAGTTGAGASAGLGSAAAPAPAAAALPVGAEAAYEQNLAAAEALPASEVLESHGDANLAYANLMTGVNNVLAAKPAVTAALKNPRFDVIAGLESLGQGFLFAATAAKRGSTRNAALQQNLEASKPLRAMLMSSAELLVLAGVFDAAAVATIRKGAGLIHSAEELVSLATLFRTNAASVAGKTPVTPAMVTQAAELGTTLLTQLTPERAPKKGATSGPTASDLRDRFYTLIVQGRAALWLAGAAAFGEDGVAQKVPPLLSHGSHTTVAKAAAKAAKVVTKATAKATKAAARAASVKPKPAKKRG